MTTEQRLLQDAAIEIKSLRNQNQLMSARLGVYDELMRLFHSQPNFGSDGLMSPDIVHQIEKHLKEKPE